MLSRTPCSLNGSDDEVDVRIALVGMQRHRVTMLKRESVQGERPYRRRSFSDGVPFGIEKMRL